MDQETREVGLALARGEVNPTAVRAGLKLLEARLSAIACSDPEPARGPWTLGDLYQATPPKPEVWFPLWATTGAWLRAWLGAGLAASDVGAASLRVLLTLWDSSCTPRYDLPLRRTQAEPDKGSIEFGVWGYLTLSHTPDALVQVALERLALGFLSRDALPTLAGYTAAVHAQELEAGNKDALLQELHSAIRAYLDVAAAAGAAFANWDQQFEVGVQLHHQHWTVFASEHLRSADLGRAVGMMIARKARYAAGHHGLRTLAGRPLDAWFAEQPFDTEGFLAALQTTPWASLDQDGRPRLLALTAFGQPMFGVFTELERNLLETWFAERRRSDGKEIEHPLDAGEDSESPLDQARQTRLRSEGNFYSMLKKPFGDLFQPRNQKTRFPGCNIFNGLQPLKMAANPVAAHGLPKHKVFQQPADPFDLNTAPRVGNGDETNIRERNRRWFYRLLNADRYPDERAIAAVTVRDGLRAASLVTAAGFGLPRDYTRAALALWLDKHVQKAAQTPQSATRSWNRETLVWGIEQFAPTILVDGSWLANVALSPQLPASLRTRFWKTYADELGCGHLTQNHPAIYRRLVASAGLDLPDAASLDFAADPRFVAGAFDLPVFLLAIGLCPETYLPELLGLNLAIELSGLGQVYLDLINRFRACGLDPTIVAVHLSIDNLASGHAALARECIDDHLERARALGGMHRVRSDWRRIRAGYAALYTNLLRFGAHLAFDYVCRRIRSNRRVL